MIIYLESRNLKLKSQMLWNGWFQLGVSLLYVKVVVPFKATSERSVSHNKRLIIMLFLLMVAMVAAFPGYSSSQFVRKGAFDKLKRVEGWPIDLKKSFMIGDRISDKKCAKRSKLYFEYAKKNFYSQVKNILKRN